MANIPLRAYIREIEGLIDSGQLEETVAHCRHVLKSFPKHINTYRLLGKVFLEARQFSNAADILQRVLSAVPDDFVSHVGMSIIREDEGNLDAAIWHMERAFENQPANKAIQDELRRLFGRRDGMEPPKIRLTRGALARMYAKGNLYDQTIAELRGALSDDPQRPDLQVLLAQMHYLSGNRVEAVETSSNLLKKLPNCLIANRILALILPQTDRSEDATIYQQRAYALDPYLPKASSDALTSADVPDGAVMIEVLDWKPGQPISGLPEQPSWAVSLGVSLEDSEEEVLPDWLSEDLVIPAYEGEQVAPFVEGDETVEGIEQEGSDGVIPDWMQDAGWEPSTGEVQEDQAIEEIHESSENDQQIQRADIPDWLKEIAPDESLDEAEISEQGIEEQIPNWLDESPPGPTDSIVSWLEDKDQISDIDETEDVFGSVEEVEIPDWLQELEEAPEDRLPTTDEIEEPEGSEESFTEIADLYQEREDKERLAEEDTAQPVSPLDTEPMEELPEWLEEGELPDSTERTGVTDWLVDTDTSIQDESPIGEIHEEMAESIAEDETQEEMDAPDWIKELKDEDDVVEVESLLGEPDLEKADLPDWLEEEEQESQEMPETGDTPQQIKTDLEIPEMEEDEHETAIGEAEIDIEDQVSGLAWLESLAAKQGASEEELITSPEERSVEPPGWVIEDAEKDEVDDHPLPDWLREAEADSAIDEGWSQTESEGQIPEWLSISEEEGSGDLETGPGISEMESSSTKMEEEDESDLEEQDLAMAWLESLAVKQGASEEELITSPEDRTDIPPDWVLEEDNDNEEDRSIPPESLTEPEVIPETEIGEEIPDWTPTETETEETTQPELDEPLPGSEEVPVEDILSTALDEEATQGVASEDAIIHDINTASLSELEKISGIGFVLAQNIIEYRQENGPFEDLSELKMVPGIGDVNYESFKDYLRIEEPSVSPTLEETSTIEVDIRLTGAREDLTAGNINQAVESFEQLIKEGQYLEEIISELESGLSHEPENIHLWQTLGDAYMRNDQFQKALEAYTKAEKLL